VAFSRGGLSAFCFLLSALPDAARRKNVARSRKTSPAKISSLSSILYLSDRAPFSPPKRLTGCKRFAEDCCNDLS
jgi:hypothetical protein